jgi:hypothetical protein
MTQTCYVAYHGDDTWSGTAPTPNAAGTDGPFASLARAVQDLGPGDTCVLRGGVYRETLRPARSGEPGRPMVFRAFPGETAVITATDVLSGWTADGEGIFAAPMAWSLEDQNQVFADGALLDEARWPHRGDGDRLHPQRAEATGGSPTTLSDPALAKVAGDGSLEGALLWCAGGDRWICWSEQVEQYDPATQTLHFTMQSASHWYETRPGSRYVLMGLRSFLNAPGEWWYDAERQRLLLIPPAGCDLAKTTVEAKRRADCIDLRGRQHVTVDGIHFQAGGVKTDADTAGIRLAHCTGTWLGHSYQRDLGDAAGVVIQGRDNAVEGCELAWSSGSLLRVSGHGHRIVNNYIHHGNYGAKWSGAVSLRGCRILFSHNTVRHSGRDLVSVHSLMESLVQHNDLSDAGWLTCDLGMTYGHDTDFMNTLFRFNVVHDIHLDGGDRRTLTPGGHTAVNNHIHHIARWNPLYKVGIQLKGCGNRAAHNRLHDLPHTAIGFTGNDQAVEYNEIYQSITHANDAGAIYTPGAHPEDWSMRGHRVRFNYLHHLFGFAGEGCSGIYLDDMFSGTEIHGNILWRVSLGFLLGGGRDILSTNNVFIDCPQAINLDARAIGWAAFSMPDVIAGLESMPYREEPWASRYPELVNILADEPALPKGNVIARNIIRRGGGIWVEDGARPGLRMENNLAQDDPHFGDEDKADWCLCPDSPALALGFGPLPLAQMGLQTSPLRPKLPPRRLFEAEVVIETPSVLRGGQPFRPGSVCLRVRNIGDEAASTVVRVHVHGGRLDDSASFACTLAPLATAEKRFTLWADTGTVRLEVVQDGVDGVLARQAIDVLDDAMTPWPAMLNVSALQPGAVRLDTLDQVPPADLLQWQSHTTEPASGFCNLHDRLATVGEADAVLWIGCRIRCSEAMRVAVLLGYDGPVKLFVDGYPVFHDLTGTNPARPDTAAPEVALAAGDHALAVALGANQGRAWGVFLQLRRTDVGSDLQIPILPIMLP